MNRLSGRALHRDERGVAFPSPLVMLSIVAVAMAGLAFVATSGDDVDQAQVVTSQPAPSASATPTEQPRADKPRVEQTPDPVQRAEVLVEVYNNSGISGLAGGVADDAATAGWQVVGSDNWVGTIPSSTVYFPPRLQREADTLARDLGITRMMPAVAPMRFDRLTVILTGDLG